LQQTAPHKDEESITGGYPRRVSQALFQNIFLQQMAPHKEEEFKSCKR